MLDDYLNSPQPQKSMECKTDNKWHKFELVGNKIVVGELSIKLDILESKDDVYLAEYFFDKNIIVDFRKKSITIKNPKYPDVGLKFECIDYN